MTIHAVVTGGGTSGHVLPAPPVIEALVDRGHPLESLRYFGAQRGVETRLVPPTGVPHTFFDVVGLQRSLDRMSDNIGFFPRLLAARRRAIAMFKADRPRVVVSVGGYASLPAVLAARRLRIPIVVVSYDRRPGRSSEITARWAAACAVAFPDSPLPRARHTGAPVRREIRRIDRTIDRRAARQRLGVGPDRFLVVAVGGSLGSAGLNSAVEKLVRESASDSTLAVRHVVGDRFLADVTQRMNDIITTSGGVRYDVIGYDDAIRDVYAGCDLFVGRGGAGTIAEVASVGVPSILVPWSGAVPVDHQTGNVRWLADRGAAAMLSDDDVVDSLVDVVRALRIDEARREQLATRAHDLGDLNRRGAIAELIDEVAQRG